MNGISVPGFVDIRAALSRRGTPRAGALLGLAVGVAIAGGASYVAAPYATGDVCLTGVDRSGHYWAAGSCGTDVNLPPCKTEDSSLNGDPCWWDARSRGNGQGASVVVFASQPGIPE
jgi:hypothetical protein